MDCGIVLSVDLCSATSMREALARTFQIIRLNLATC